MQFSRGSSIIIAAMAAAVCSVTLMTVLTSPRSEAQSRNYDPRVAECLIDNLGKAEVREAVPVIVDACLSLN